MIADEKKQEEEADEFDQKFRQFEKRDEGMEARIC